MELIPPRANTRMQKSIPSIPKAPEMRMLVVDEVEGETVVDVC
jgi:hypothetical protein